MYFAILGKHTQISLAELNVVEPVFYPSTKKGIVLFDTEHPELLAKLGGCIKSWIVVAEKQLQEILQDVKIIGIQEEAIGKHFKRTIGIRRFKTVKINHTDKEIKTKGKEIINLDNGKYGVVEQYQDIPLYEVIDFDKPARSMHMGMMPAKLTHILINLGIAYTQNHDNTTIYDPFCWSGTTCFLANALGYDTLGSDLKIQYAEENYPRRKTTSLHNTEHTLSFFTQDSTKPINISGNSNLIVVTEGRLGPIVTKQTTLQEVAQAQDKVLPVYQKFIENILDTKWVTTVIFTIPYYIGHQNILEQKLQQLVAKTSFKRKTIAEVYAREEQQIGRKICIISQ